MPFDNYFVILFKSENSDEFIQKGKWYLFDVMKDIIFEIIGIYDIIFDNFGISPIFFNKN